MFLNEDIHLTLSYRFKLPKKN